MSSTPNWFDPDEYYSFLAESSILFEFNAPLQKEKIENRKKLWAFDASTARKRANLRMEIMRDNARAKARGIQMGLGENFKEKMTNEFLARLEEEKTPIKAEKSRMRPEVNPADKDRDRKREDRRQNDQKDIFSTILIVKNRKTKRTEIIEKDTYDPKNHTVIKGKVKTIDKGDVTENDVKQYSKVEDFLNTKTSIKILGKIEKQGKEEGEEEVSIADNMMPPAPRPRIPQDGKEITDPVSTFPDWDHNIAQMVSMMPDVLNSLSGKEASPAYQETVSTSRTLGDTFQRLIAELTSTNPELAQYKYELVQKPLKTDKNFAAATGIKEYFPDNLIIASGGKEKIGMIVKIGEQIRPAKKGEAGLVLTSIINTVGLEAITPKFNIFVDDFIQKIKTKLSKSSGYKPPIANIEPLSAGRQQLNKERWMAETLNSQKKMFFSEVCNLLEDFINSDADFKNAFISEGLTNAMKFNSGLGSAQQMIAAKKDGTDAKLIPLNDVFLINLANSSDTDLSFKFTQTPGSSQGFYDTLTNKLMPLNESGFEVANDLENIKSQLGNPLTLMQLMEIQMTDAVFKKPIDYTEFYTQDSDATNTITINYGNSAEELKIPVQKSFDAMGNPENTIEKSTDELFESYILLNDYLVEQIKSGKMNLLDSIMFLEEEFDLIEKRNYRKEYDNYHSKPEQRANRSKRVLARRKMEEQGRVKKGDGKDVDHKNGNPQDNSDDNLRVLSKSKNRSMNEDHGAGFEGTDALLQNLVDQTPFAINPIKSKKAKYSEDKFVKKQK